MIEIIKETGTSASTGACADINRYREKNRCEHRYRHRYRSE
jgi:hypothetical protein